MSEFATVEQDGYSVSSNTESEADLRANFEATPVAPAEKVAAAGDAEPAAKVDEPPTSSRERNTDGTFKAKAGEKADEPVKAAAAAPDKAAKPRDDPQARIDQAVGRQREAERRAEAAERRAAELEAARTAPKAPTAQEPARESQKQTWERLRTHPQAPKEDDFESFADFTFAATAFINETLHAEREQVAHQQHAQEQRQRAVHQQVTNWTEHVDAAIKADPQFLNTLSEDVLSLRPTFSLQRGERRSVYNAIADELLDAGAATGPLMRHLSSHPEDFQRLATLPPRDLTRQMAILASRLTAASTGTAATAPAVSQAKPPVRPVTGSPTFGSDDPPGDDADYDQHRSYWNARDRKAGSGRR